MDSFSGDNIPSMSEALSHLIESIALEEKALSKLVASEASKINAFVGIQRNFPLKPSSDDLIRFNHSIISVLDTIQMAEWLLFKKLHTVSQMSIGNGERVRISSIETEELDDEQVETEESDEQEDEQLEFEESDEQEDEQLDFEESDEQEDEQLEFEDSNEQDGERVETVESNKESFEEDDQSEDNEQK